jgi:hypothetical protein
VRITTIAIWIVILRYISILIKQSIKAGFAYPADRYFFHAFMREYIYTILEWLFAMQAC